MRILVDARLYGLENAGLGRYVMNLVDELSKIDTQNEYILLLKNKYFHQLNCPANFKKVLTDISHYSFKEQLLLPRIINSYTPDLVHFPHSNVPIGYRGKYVVTIHDLLIQRQNDMHATTLKPIYYHAKRLAYKVVVRNAVKVSQKILVPSSAVKSEILEYYKVIPDKVVVTYEGFKKKKYNSKNSTKIIKKYNIETPYFIYVGNAYPHKNLKRALNAIVRLNQHSRVGFAIISARNIFTEKLAKEINKTKAKEYVRLLGFVPDEDLSILYNKALGYLFPSLSEGFGLPGIEAINAGTILIASDIPVFREVYRDCAMYFNPYRIDDIVKIMRQVLNLNDKERLDRIHKGKIFVERYSWNKMARETLDVYNKAAHNN